MGAVKGKLPLVEKNPQPLGVILRLEEELGKGKNIVIVLFFVAVSKYVTRNMENCIFGICNNAMGERRELNPRMVDSQSTALIHLATSAPYPAKGFSLFSIHYYSIYSDLRTSIEILDIECHSLKRKKGVISCDTKKNESFCSSSFIGKDRKGQYEGGERNNSNVVPGI